MAKPVEQITLGIDISKDELVVYRWDKQELARLSNEPAAIRAWLAQFASPLRIALEPTSSYHFALIEQASAHRATLYLVNARQLAHYREALNQRHKTDPEDAYLLARYLEHEAAQLRPYTPRCPKAQQLWALLKRRAAVVAARKQLQQSLAELPAQALFTQFRHLLGRIDRRMQALIGELGWSDDFQRCRSLPGCGPLNATALVCAYHRGAFASSNAFIAFLGLDVRRRESGRFKGKRKLTKRGESELRRLLYCAATPARSYPPFEQYRQRQLDKGLSKTAANVALARKLARIAFALMEKQQSFNRQPTMPCSAT